MSNNSDEQKFTPFLTSKAVRMMAEELIDAINRTGKKLKGRTADEIQSLVFANYIAFLEIDEFKKAGEQEAAQQLEERLPTVFAMLKQVCSKNFKTDEHELERLLAENRKRLVTLWSRNQPFEYSADLEKKIDAFYRSHEAMILRGDLTKALFKLHPQQEIELKRETETICALAQEIATFYIKNSECRKKSGPQAQEYLMQAHATADQANYALHGLSLHLYGDLADAAHSALGEYAKGIRAAWQRRRGEGEIAPTKLTPQIESAADRFLEKHFDRLSKPLMDYCEKFITDDTQKIREFISGMRECARWTVIDSIVGSDTEVRPTLFIVSMTEEEERTLFKKIEKFLKAVEAEWAREVIAHSALDEHTPIDPTLTQAAFKSLGLANNMLGARTSPDKGRQ